ncbi:MAG TPA: iron-containing redox enzyme family protein [Kiloniellales bacterium]|nr:iron-containing redox enzyme family protein [Kiloniellales bacterium]
MAATKSDVIKRLDQVVHDFCDRCAYFHEPFNLGRAKMFVYQHRLNTRQRNSVLKLKVATNTPIWDLKLDIIHACTEEIIADEEHGGGRPHWAILEELGTHIGMPLEEIRAQEPLTSTRIAWLAWEALMGNRHWLEGLIANTCAERANIPGYGSGPTKPHGWFGLERKRWNEVLGVPDEKLEFFELHEEADIAHSDVGWNAVAEHAERLHMADAVVEACRINLQVWEMYLNGIGAAGDELNAKLMSDAA